MATDQEIRDAGFKYIPQQKYLLNPFTLPTTDDDDDGDNTPSANVGGNPEGFSVYNPDPNSCLLYTSPSPRDRQKSRMPSSA